MFLGAVHPVYPAALGAGGEQDGEGEASTTPAWRGVHGPPGTGGRSARRPGPAWPERYQSIRSRSSCRAYSQAILLFAGSHPRRRVSDPPAAASRRSVGRVDRATTSRSKPASIAMSRGRSLLTTATACRACAGAGAIRGPAQVISASALGQQHRRAPARFSAAGRCGGGRSRRYPVIDVDIVDDRPAQYQLLTDRSRGHRAPTRSRATWSQRLGDADQIVTSTAPTPGGSFTYSVPGHRRRSRAPAGHHGHDRQRRARGDDGDGPGPGHQEGRGI